MLTILGFFGKGMKILLSFIGVDKTIAQTQIVSEGFTVGTVTQSDSADPAQLSDHNKVISQTPAATTLIDYETPVNITWRNFSFSPYSFTPYAFTPQAYSFTPFTFTPNYSFTPYAFTPYAFTPYAFTPAAQSSYYAYCGNTAVGYPPGAIITGSDTVSCATAQASLNNMGEIGGGWICSASPLTGSEPGYPTFASCGGTPYSFTPYAFTPYAFTPYAFTPYAFTPATTQYWAYCGNTSVGYPAGTVITGNGTQSCASAQAQLTTMGEIGGAWICQSGTAPTPPTAQTCGAPAYSFTPYAFTPMAYSFTPTAYSFTPYAFTPMAYSFTPYAFTPAAYSFTPNSNCNDLSLITNSQTCAACGGTWNALFGECS